MIAGHGDDIQGAGQVRINMSSNVPMYVDHSGLYAHLSQCLPQVCHYPEPVPMTLEAQLAARMGLDATQVMVTNGATEAIYLVAQAHAGHCSAILQPTFSEYADAASMHGHRVEHLHAWPAHLYDDVQMVWMCNPNNPTGQVWAKGDVIDLIERYPGVVFVIDQSYEHFTTLPLLQAAEAVRYPNVILLHSMTKQFCVPGLRIGYITACTQLTDRICRCRMPWSVNQMAISGAQYLMAHADHYRIDVPALMRERERTARMLQETRLVEVYPSDSHILLCRLRIGRAAALKEYLLQHHGILIRDACNFRGLDDGHFRIAVQNETENRALVDGIIAFACE